MGRMTLLGGGGSSGLYPYLNSETAVYVGAIASPPDDVHKGVIDTLVSSLKAGAVGGSNLFAKADQCLLLAGATGGALINLITPGTGDGTLVDVSAGSLPTITVDQGVATASGNYIGLINPTTFSGAKFVQNSNAAGFWCRTDSQSNASRAWQFDGTDGHTISLRNTNSAAGYRANNATQRTSANSSMLSSAHWIVVNRSSATAFQLYVDGALFDSGSQTSSALNNAIMRLGSTSDASFVASEFSISWLSSSLTANDNTDLYNSFNSYKTSLGF